MTKVVIKRDGSEEALNTQKIKNVIEWACAGLDVNPLALESKIEDIVVDEGLRRLSHQLWIDEERFIHSHIRENDVAKKCQENMSS